LENLKIFSKVIIMYSNYSRKYQKKKPKQKSINSDMAMILKYLKGQKKKPAVLPISVYTDRAYDQSVNSEPKY
tara:strand:- start:204 stop:422 length:219 start_codon:yes stop_codon:yes gene_type:complete